MSGLSLSVAFATESLSLVELWRAASVCLYGLNLDGGESYARVLYESPNEWVYDGRIRPNNENVGQLAAEQLGLSIHFSIYKGPASLHCELVFFPSFPDASDANQRQRYSATLSFGTILHRQLYPNGDCTIPAKEAPFKALKRLILTLARSLSASAFVLMSDSEAGLVGLTAQDAIRYHKHLYSNHKTEVIESIPEYPEMLGISTEAISHDEFYLVAGSGSKYITESDGYLIDSAMEYA